MSDKITLRIYEKRKSSKTALVHSQEEAGKIAMTILTQNDIEIAGSRWDGPVYRGWYEMELVPPSWGWDNEMTTHVVRTAAHIVNELGFDVDFSGDERVLGEIAGEDNER